MFSNVRSVLSQCNTRLRPLHLLCDIEVMWRKTIKHAVSMFYTLIKQGFLTNQSAHRVFTHKWPGYAGSFTSNSTSLQQFIAHLMKIPKYRTHVKDLISNRFGNASEKKKRLINSERNISNCFIQYFERHYHSSSGQS